MENAAVCPACVAGPAPDQATVEKAAGDQAILLSLPGIHCAGCIAGVERALQGVPGVASARVNLSLKRATVQAAVRVTPETLVEVLEQSGYAAAELDPQTIAATTTDAGGRDLLLRIAVAGFAMMNVMLLSIAVWSGADAATRDMFHWISAAIAIPAVMYSGRPFFQNAAQALSARRVNMDVPISLALLLALGSSIYETALSGHHAYFEAAVSLAFFLLIGRYLDHRARMAARSAADELAALETPRAMLMRAGGEVTVPVGDLAVGDVIRVVPGARIPVDGRIRAGATDLDRALLTGESLPVTAGPGFDVHAGEVTLTGALEVEVTKRAKDSTLQSLRELVEVAERAKSSYTSMADVAAKQYVPFVSVMALVALVGWYLGTGDLRVSLNVGVAVLIITCPCAMALAIPTVSTVATGRLFRRGVLVKSPTALERLTEVTRVMCDKTGTLTEGQPQMVNAPAAEVLALAAGLARGSGHPLAQAVLAEAEAREIAPAPVTDLREYPGQGVRGLFEGRTVRLGSAEWLGAGEAAGLATYLDDGRTGPQALTFKDRLRKGAAEAVARLEDLGLPVEMLTGDVQANADAIAAELGITRVHANLRPEGKTALVEQAMAEGEKVLFLGDGLNDTAALGLAHLSISPAAAVDASRAVSDVVLLNGDLANVPYTLHVAGQARGRMKENLWLATAYNLIAVPVALAGFVTPLIAALAMSGSSIVVSLNALRIRR